MRLLLLGTLLPGLCLAANDTYSARLAAQAEPFTKYCAAPADPVAAQDGKPSGGTVIDVQLAPDGRVLQSRILKSSGHREFDKAIMIAATRCTYPPQIVNGLPSATWLKLEHQWDSGPLRRTAALATGGNGTDTYFPAFARNHRGPEPLPDLCPPS